MAVLLSCLLSLTLSFNYCVSALFGTGSDSRTPIDLNPVLFRERRDIDFDWDKPTITDLYITSNVESRFAVVSLASRVVNLKERSLEASFKVQIPESAFISNFSMTIDGKVTVSKVYEKKQAQKRYNDAKNQGQSAGQVRHQAKAGRGMDVFNINVNVAAMSDVHFELTYQELLERRLGLYAQRIMVQPLQVVNNLTLDLTFQEPQQFNKFTFQEPNGTDINTASTESTVVTATPNTRRLTYRPSASAQRAVDEQRGIVGEFVVTYDVGHKSDGGNIISAGINEFFVHYFVVEESTEIPAIPKNIMFVIDISGSMNGRKIEQTRDAMKVILPQLNSEDYFNILLFDDSLTAWQRHSIKATRGNLKFAKSFVEDEVKAVGSTDINMALVESTEMVVNDPNLRDRAGIIVFLTDGRPTAGTTNLHNIRKNIYNRNEGQVSIFSLGFGENVDFEFLEMISLENGGFAKRIYEEADAANQLIQFFKEVNVPLLQNVRFEYLPEQVPTSDLTRTTFKQFFDGTEVIVSGKKTADRIDATVRGSTKTNTIELVVPDSSKTEISGPSGEFTEKLWAYLTIKDLLRKKTIARSETDRQYLESRALNMSLTYNLVTPLTSLLVVQEHHDVSQAVSGRRKVKLSGNTRYDRALLLEPAIDAGSVHASPSALILWLCSMTVFGLIPNIQFQK